MSGLSFSRMSLAISLFAYAVALPCSAPAQSPWRITGEWVERNVDGEWTPFFGVASWAVPVIPPDSDFQTCLQDVSAHFNILLVRDQDIEIWAALLPSDDDLVFESGLTDFAWRFRYGYNTPHPCTLAPRIGSCAWPADSIKINTYMSLGPPNGYTAANPGVTFTCSGRLDYAGSRYITEHVNEFSEYIDANVVQYLADRATHVPLSHPSIGRDRFFWLLADEPDNNLYGWPFSPALLGTYHDLARAEIDSPTYIGLAALRGSKYTFEMLYRNAHGGELPDSLPILPEDVSQLIPGNWRGDPSDYLTYSFMSDGTPEYVFCPSTSAFKGNPGWWGNDYYNTIRDLAAAYGGSCSILGLNNYGPFESNPAIAGEAVDAIREGRPSPGPIWLYFDGWGYQKRNLRAEELTPQMFEEYADKVQCQAFVSIMHGATGIKLYTASRADTLFPSLTHAQAQPLVEAYWARMKELTGRVRECMPLILGSTVQQDLVSPVQYVVKEQDGGSLGIIVANTTSGSPVFSLPILQVNRSLAPYEIYFADLGPTPTVFEDAQGELHYVVKDLGEGRYGIIVTNTGSSPHLVSLPFYQPNVSLQPGEVHFAELSSYACAHMDIISAASVLRGIEGVLLYEVKNLGEGRYGVAVANTGSSPQVLSLPFYEPNLTLQAYAVHIAEMAPHLCFLATAMDQECPAPSVAAMHWDRYNGGILPPEEQEVFWSEPECQIGKAAGGGRTEASDLIAQRYLHAEAGDFNGDGDDELIYTHYKIFDAAEIPSQTDDMPTEVHYFQAGQVYPMESDVELAPGEWIRDLEVSDLNGDGNDDIICAIGDTTGLGYGRIMFADTLGAISTATYVGVASCAFADSQYTVTALGAGDVNGDGRGDLFVGLLDPAADRVLILGFTDHYSAGNGISIWSGYGSIPAENILFDSANPSHVNHLPSPTCGKIDAAWNWDGMEVRALECGDLDGLNGDDELIIAFYNPNVTNWGANLITVDGSNQLGLPPIVGQSCSRVAGWWRVEDIQAGDVDIMSPGDEVYTFYSVPSSTDYYAALSYDPNGTKFANPYVFYPRPSALPPAVDNDYLIRAFAIGDFRHLYFANHSGRRVASMASPRSLAASPEADVAGLTLACESVFTGSSLRLALSGKAAAEDIKVRIYDVAGRCVWESELEALPGRGTAEIAWPGTDTRGRSVASGVYFATATTEAGQRATAKLLRIK